MKLEQPGRNQGDDKMMKHFRIAGILLTLLCVGCEKMKPAPAVIVPMQAVIVAVWQDTYSTGSGWTTTVQLPNGERIKLEGVWGELGDRFIVQMYEHQAIKWEPEE